MEIGSEVDEFHDLEIQSQVGDMIRVHNMRNRVRV